ncbi:hypothetical protein G6F38_012303 [Rhizopus arrhizus]|nr:hypothetical protein G6F38_012303 [Rhizopus arrhizus]
MLKSLLPDTVATGVVVGAVTEAIVTDKETATVVEDIVKKTDTVDVDVIVGEQEVDVVTKDKTISDSHIDVVVKETKQVVDNKKTESSGVIAGAVTEAIVNDEKVASAVESIITDAESVTVEIIGGDKKVDTVVDTSAVEQVASKVDTVKKTDTSKDFENVKDTTKDSVTSKIGTVAAGIVAGAVVEAIANDKPSEIETTVKESKGTIVEVTADDKKSEVVIGEVDTEDATVSKVDVTLKETVTSDVISVEDVVADTSATVITGITTEDISTDKETSASVEVITGDKKIETVGVSKPVQEQTIIEFVTKNEAVATGIVVGAVTEAVIRDQKVVSAIEDIVKKYGDVSIEVVTTEKPTGLITADSKIGIIVKETEIVNDQRIKEIETAPVDTTGIIASVVAERIVKDKETASKVGTIIGQSDSVTIEVITGTTVTQNVIDVTDVVIDETQVKTETVSIPEAITAGVIAGGVVSAVIGSEKVLSNVDTIVQGSGSFDVELITDKDTDKYKSTSQLGFVLKESAPVDSAVTKKNNTSIGAIVARTIAESVLGNKDTSSVVGNTAQTSDAIAIQIISGDEKVETVVDTTAIVTEEIDIVEKVVTETVANDIKEISVIDTKKPKSVDVDEKTTAIIEDKTAHTSQVDVIQKETDQWATGDKTITKPNTGVSKTESAVAAVVVGAVTEAIVADKETATVVEDIVKKTDTVDVDVIVGEQEVDVVTKDKTISDSHIDVI